jgi:putative ABC transport system substrate-binding protein
MDRREVIGWVSFGAIVWTIPVLAQSGSVAKIGFLGNSTAALEGNLVAPFLEGLREQGYVEGRDVVLEYRWAEGDYSRFPALVAELLAAKVDVIVTAGTPSAEAVKNATKVTPCVMVAVGDPIGNGLVTSLARPGGNLTGFSSIAPDLEGKRLALLREVTPKLRKVTVLWNPANPFSVASERHVRAAARTLRIDLRFVAIRASDEVAGALAAITAEQPDALMFLADRVLLHERRRLMDFAAEHKLPGIYPYREMVEAGGLMSYGPSYADLHRRAAIYVAKILRGAKPAELPVEEPSKFEFVFNLRAANALGIEPAAALLARVDEVIE